MRHISIWAAIGLTASMVTPATPQKSKEKQASMLQVNVAIDPRSSGEAEAELLTNGFRKLCPNVSIVSDKSQAKYVVLASESNPLRGFLLHYYITVSDAEGKVVFTVDKHHDKSATEAVCRFINAQQ